MFTFPVRTWCNVPHSSKPHTRTMSWQDTPEFIFTILRVMGILPVAYCREREMLIVTKKYENYMLCVSVGIIILVEYLLIAICIGSFSDSFDIFSESKTNKSLVLLQLCECGGFQLYLSATMYLFRHKNVEIFNKILMYYRLAFRHKSSGSTERRIGVWCIANATLIVVFSVNMGLSSVRSPCIMWFMYICQLLISSIHFAYCSVYIFCFTCAVQILNKLLRDYNDKLKVNLNNNSVSDIVIILRERTELLALCSRYNMGTVYGLAMAIQAIFILSNILGFIFVTTVMFNWHTEMLVSSLQLIIPTALYSLPPLIVYSNALWVNNIDKEANKTAKILAKCPRCNSGVDKMISKFLLKNLRQKPILTAYGFFSLDKSTLFKLFTAVFTYMVILVQFKEMESNTTKSDNNNS